MFTKINTIGVKLNQAQRNCGNNSDSNSEYGNCNFLLAVATSAVATLKGYN